MSSGHCMNLNKPVAVGLEMFRKNNQDALDQYVQGKLSNEQFLPVYYNNWSMPWPLYGGIFEYAREHGMALVGLNIPDETARKIARQGFEALTEAEKKELPAGISCNVYPTYMEFIKRAYAGHGMHGGDFANFCQAQMVWDKSMAWNLMNYLRKNQGTTMVVLAGVGHAWKRGISGHVDDESDLTYRVLLPLLSDETHERTLTTEDADYVLLD